MNLVLVRDLFSDRSTQGALFLDDGKNQECFTLEMPNKDGRPGSCIPQGVYVVLLNHSPKFSGDEQFVELCKRLNVPPLMPEIMGIPGRSEIRIHWGNEPENTEGCILLGETRVPPDFIGESRAAFASFYPKLLIGAAAGPVFIEVIGGAKISPADPSAGAASSDVNTGEL